MNDWYKIEQLHIAAQDGNLARAREPVEQGSDVNLFDELGYTPLHYVTKGAHLDVMRFLIEAGADVNARDDQQAGETPLGEVAQNCTLEVAQLLVESGADPTIPGWMQITALHRASQRKKSEGRRVFELFAKAVAKRTQQDR